MFSVGGKSLETLGSWVQTEPPKRPRKGSNKGFIN
jgi:hypothetical protein